jgi:signal transduction histidine kinase/ribosomal protein L24
VLLARDGKLHPLAHFGSLPPSNEPSPIALSSVPGTAVVEGRTVHIPDLFAPEWDRYEHARQRSKAMGVENGAILVAPLKREGKSVGAILIRKREPTPFTDSQITLVESFADQAVIAVENVRLFNETKEALDQQTATSEILNVIASSPTEVQPVLDAIAENAARVCGASDAHIYRVDGEILREWGHKGPIDGLSPGETLPLSRDSLIGRCIVDRRVIHIEDAAELDPAEYPISVELQRRWGYRTSLSVPLMRHDVAVGGIAIRRTEVKPFTSKQIELLQTFADQAVIAVENVRLFNETKEALERQTATAEVLKSISRAPFELQPILDTLVETAGRLVAADQTDLIGREGGVFRDVAHFGASSEEYRHALLETMAEGYTPSRGTLVGRTLLERRPVQIVDSQNDPEYQLKEVQRIGGFRTMLGVPLLRQNEPIGVISVERREVRAFDEKQIELLTTFADQAVIAIENVRLFKEIQQKSQQLEIASRHKSEFLANMSHELRTPLNAIIGFSEVLLEKIFGPLNPKQEEYLADVLSSGRHLLTLINDILDLSKIEAGRMDLERGTFSLRTALENGVTMVRERASRHEIQLGLDVGDELEEVSGDERKVKQVIYNLLSNAVKFTPDGGRVDVSAAREDGHVRVIVRDTGIGIAPNDQERIFEEFSQVGRDPERSREGTGLGLTLSKRFVELHGGRITVESAPGKGSAFTFTLPQP